MGNYSTVNHNLRFNEYFDTIEVVNAEDTVVASFNLATSNQSTSVTVSASSYVVNTGEEFDEPTHTIDVGNGSTLGFNGDFMGGIGIVDLRDIGMQAEPENMMIQHDLKCCIFRLRYVSGAFALKIHAADTDCITWEPA